MRPLVIYHSNCADGFSAAWCFWRKFGDAADYHPGVYSETPPPVKDRDVYLVDFSYKRQVVEQMLKEAHSVTLIDHHKTAIDDLSPLRREHYDEEQKLNWFCDLNRSGATLAWDYLFPGEPRPMLLNYVEDRDLWRFNLPNTREIQSFVFSHDYSFQTWDKMVSADQAEIVNMIAAGTAIERKHHKDVAELLKFCQRRMVIAGHNVPVANLPYTMSSDAGHIMGVGEPFAACYTDTAEHRVFSLRSAIDGLDVGEVAKLFGGGGHKHASGFRVPRDHELAKG